jgi:dihydrodipicolinate reductase
LPASIRFFTESQPVVIIGTEGRPTRLEKNVKKALDTSTTVAIQEGSVGFMKLQTVYFQYVPSISASSWDCKTWGKHLEHPIKARVSGYPQVWRTLWKTPMPL